MTEKFLQQIWYACLAGRVLAINVLFLSEITWHIQNWHNARWNFSIARCYLLCDVTFRKSFAKFTEKVEVKLGKTDMQTYSCTVTGSETKLKAGSGRSKTARAVENV